MIQKNQNLGNHLSLVSEDEKITETLRHLKLSNCKSTESFTYFCSPAKSAEGKAKMRMKHAALINNAKQDAEAANIKFYEDVSEVTELPPNHKDLPNQELWAKLVPLMRDLKFEASSNNMGAHALREWINPDVFHLQRSGSTTKLTVPTKSWLEAMEEKRIENESNGLGKFSH